MVGVENEFGLIQVLGVVTIVPFGGGVGDATVPCWGV